MPAQMLTHAPDVLHGCIRIEGSIQIRAQEINSGDDAIRALVRACKILCPSDLAHGIVGNELSPHGLDDVPFAGVSFIVFGKVDPGKGAVVAN